jgi:hypothetical protein
MIRQAYVSCNVPIGNGVEVKLGRFDSILGYESIDTYKNANSTRSVLFQLLPTGQTGVSVSYDLCEHVNFTGVAANYSGTRAGRGDDINLRVGEVDKAFIGRLRFKPSPDSKWNGAFVDAGVIYGHSFSRRVYSTEAYLGGAVSTPSKRFTFGLANYYRDDAASLSLYAVDVYASFQASADLSIHSRVEYGRRLSGPIRDILNLTETLQYDLWRNVISRLEVKWERSALFIAEPRNNVIVLANLIYKF